MVSSFPQNIHANQWSISDDRDILTFTAIHRDPELYPDPETYNPIGWLHPKFPTFREPLTQYPNVQNYSMFGFGKRICPGMIAERSLHIPTARLLFHQSWIVIVITQSPEPWAIQGLKQQTKSPVVYIPFV